MSCSIINNFSICNFPSFILNLSCNYLLIGSLSSHTSFYIILLSCLNNSVTIAINLFYHHILLFSFSFYLFLNIDNSWFFTILLYQSSKIFLSVFIKHLDIYFIIVTSTFFSCRNHLSYLFCSNLSEL